jgi:hypothetical protein
MDWNAQIGRELRELDGIAAILLSLAGLAERAIGAPLPVRWLVLWFLRQAEAVATEFVAESAWGVVAPLHVRRARGRGSRPTDAVDLALSLSRLSCAVAIMVTRLRRQAFLHRSKSLGARTTGRQHAAPGAFSMAALRVGCPDTS